MPGKSSVWRFMTKEGVQVGCRLCSATLKYCGNTTNLSNHLVTKHNSVHKKKELQEPHRSDEEKVDDPDAENDTATAQSVSSPSTQNHSAERHTSSRIEKEDAYAPPPKRKITEMRIDECLGRSASFKTGGVINAQITNAILCMIAKDELPLATVENEGFRHLMKTTVPLYTVPSRQTCTRLIENKYVALKDIFTDRLKSCTSLTLTTDVWTSEMMTTRSFMGVTAHFLQKSELQSATIGVIPLHEAHTAENLGRALESTCEDWGIRKDCVTAVVTDNGANIVKAIEITYGHQKHLPCFAHTLNLVPHKAINATNGLPELIKKVKAIVTFFKQSVRASDELRQLQLANGKSEGTCLKLKQDVATKWNSTFEMLDRFVQLSDSVGSVLLKFPKGATMVSGAELATLQGVKKILAPLAQVTTELSSEKNVTVSKVIPMVKLMRVKISAIEPIGDLIVCDLKRAILAEFESRFAHIEQNMILAIGTILDPRFKKIHFNSPVAVASAVTWITSMAAQLSTATQVEHTEPSIRPARLESDDDDLWGIHDDIAGINAANAQAEIRGGVAIETKNYLQRGVVTDRRINPFIHWDTVRAEYPTLYQVATKYLPVVATSVPSERLFSKAGLIITQQRNRLSEKHLSMLLFLGSLETDMWRV